MGMKNFILAENAGKQAWQIIRDEVYPGIKAHDSGSMNTKLVMQWLAGLEQSDEAAPDCLARGLLHGGIRQTSPREPSRAAKPCACGLDSHAPGCGEPDEATSAAGHWRLVRAKIYGVARDSEAPQMVLTPKPYSGLLGLYGSTNWLIRKLGPQRWTHTVGIHCDGYRTYIFDPSCGLAVFNAQDWGPISRFFAAMWSDYRMDRGDLADITL